MMATIDDALKAETDEGKLLAELPPLVKITIINESTVCTDAEIAPMVNALQKQVSGDFAPLWGIDAALGFVPKGGVLPVDQWWIAVLDDSTQAGILGYHDLTSAGLPIGKVFAKTDKAAGDSVSVTISHELLEILGDPFVNLSAQMGDGNFYAYEVGDPVEADAIGYLIDGILVSDFVLPSYFEQGSTSKFDFKGHLSAGCPALTPGGYISEYNAKTNSWTQILVRHSRADLVKAHAQIGSRRWRRGVALNERIRSTERPYDGH